MAVRIRLKRQGQRNSPFYRVVVTEEHYSRNGKVLENLGVYDPQKSPILFDIKEDRVKHWLSVGAQPSDTVRRFLANLGLVEKPEQKTYSYPGVSKKVKKTGEHLPKRPEPVAAPAAEASAPVEEVAAETAETPSEAQ